MGKEREKQHSLIALEYSGLKQLLGRYVSTEAGRDLLDRLGPLENSGAIEEQHAITAEANEYLREDELQLRDVASLADALSKLGVHGSCLEIPEIEAVGHFLGQVESLRVRWTGEGERFPGLRSLSQRLPDLRNLARHLGRAVSNGEIHEKYSPTLARIRRAKKRLLSKLNQKLESILRSASYAAQVQEQWISIRNGRYVIPVRAEQKRTFGGVIHGSSSSGATVFMEPLATLELNNDLVRLQEDEFREVRRILVELTGQVAERADGLQHAVSICADLDLTFAKARFGRDFDCVRPCASADRRLGLVRARHPLLEDHLRRRGLQAVPISIEMGPNSYVLIVSGPNAGGKTVALKTVGLFALMNQSGVPLPAEEATVPVFDRILADIGDQQSIANELSTFSAHVLAIRSMLEAASSDSLILLDEIGTSTEPGEGAALARAVVEAFREIGAVTVATTHYNRLKLYAESTPSVANAAMEFNETTLEPTYRLLHGLAGSSSGLKIAERLGLTGPIVERARALQDAADVEAARYVDELRERVRVLEDRKRQFEDEQEHFKVWKQQEAERVQAQRREEVRRGERRVESIVRELSERARRELKSAGEESVRRFKRRLAQSEARAVSEVHRELEVERADSGTGPSVAPAEIKTGALVRIPSLGITGSVSAVMPGGVEVIAGNMHIRRPLDDIEFLGGAPVTLPKGVSFAFQPRLESHEIHLIGSHVDEALPRIDKFLDDAYLAQAGRVRIIHGSGMGVLRRAVAGFLKGHPHVAHFDPALPNEGGAGVTIVTLRD